MKRNIDYLILGLIATTLGLLSCKKEIAPASEFAPYISAYTSGLIEPTSSIFIELTNEQPDVQPNTELKKNGFSFNPSIKGKAYWLNSRIIEFVPEEGSLKNGKTYDAEFRLGQLTKVSKRLKTFRFSFRVEDKNFALHIDPIDIPDSKTASVKGVIRFSDNVDIEDVKNSLTVTTSDNQTLSATVEANMPKSFHFSIEDIKRQKEEVTLTVKVGGKSFGINKDLTETVIIPEVDAFKVLSAETIFEPELGIQITFTDPLSSTQDLRGLITIKEFSEKFVYQIKNNKLNLYFDRKDIGKVTLFVSQNVKNYKGERLKSSFTTELIIRMLKPEVQLLSSGTILPNTGNLIVPFKAVNLKAIDVRVIRIYESNVLMFLQENTLSSGNNLRRSGRLVYKKTFRLDTESGKSLQNWNNYSLDLSDIVKQEPGAIYRIELSFKKEYSTYRCEDELSEETMGKINELTRISDDISDEETQWDTPQPYYYSNDDYDWEYYDWQERDNPCHPTYYMLSERKISYNVLASNLGVIAKANSENKLWVAVSNLIDTKPVSGATVNVYNYQLQVIATAKTDGDGFAVITPKGKPFVLIVEADKQKTYLRLVDGENNSLSRFDVGGKKIDKGLKGYIYGERGVWRPGDTLYLTFVLYDQENKLPDNHPVSFEIYNPRGQFYNKQVAVKGENGFYTFEVATNSEDPTGLWNAYVKVGGTSFHKSLRIETIKPNRLKINFNFSDERLDAFLQQIPVTLDAAWLTGAIARNLEARVEMTLSKVKTQFKAYENYIFTNPATDFYTYEKEVFRGNVSEEGQAKFNMKLPSAEDAPGILSANIVCRVFEKGGDASIYTQTIPFSPFKSYVGINLNQKEGSWIETDTKHTFDIVTLNADGKTVNRNDLEYKIYRVGWSWWWEGNSETFANYVTGSSYTPVAQGKLKTVNGKASFNFTLNYPDWGRYLVYVKDRESGHATGGVVYIDWPSWRGRSSKSDPSGIKMLSFSTDKNSYEVGEDITVVIPAAGGGTALVALENGSSVISRVRVPLAEKGDTKYKIKATKEMAPNFYIHISLLQPHAQAVNDLPIRMYGVMPVLISNKETKLNPQIEMPDVLRPETEFTVRISEKSGRPMTYTLAIVDDGLLDLTNFKTPNTWNEFYAREALGIRTWDMYDDVMGSFSGKFGQMFSIGGDEDTKPGNTKANRFRPVVKFLGPFTIGKDEKQTHRIKLPMYVGSVRTMVVAGANGVYGNAEKTTPVRSPLMILSSLPRVMSTDEEISLPVNVFVMENSVKDVMVKVETSGLAKLSDGDKKSLNFTKTGDEMLYFTLKTGSKTGIEKVTITATGGGQTAKETIEIDVRNPNPPVVEFDNRLLNPDETAEFNYRLTGTLDDDWLKIEVSRIPSFDISRRFEFLYSYEHCCSEQLTSKALPLLFISQFKDVSKIESETIRKNVREAINNLYGRQLANGGIVYWPGQSSPNEWITSYAGSFLAMAKEKGYDVNEGVLNKWKTYQRKQAQSWAPSSTDNYYARQSEFQQAYRLYALALANSAELGAMNRLKEQKKLSQQTRWCLAAAYALDGKTKVAQELVFNIPTDVEPYWDSYTYGSSDRDEAMILEALVLMGNLQDAFTQAQKVSKNLSRETYFSTQSTAYSLMAMSALAEKMSGSINFSWVLNGKKQDDVKSAKAIYQTELAKKPAEGKISITNKNTKGVLYVNVVSKSKPLVDNLPAIANNLRLDVSYTDLEGASINIDELKQGADFVAVVKVSNISPTSDYTDVALTHIIPSGWEIFNERMTNLDDNVATASKSFTYQDIRDDRVLTYFDLRRGQAKQVKIRLQATYTGYFVLPAVLCEAMYDTSAQARTKADRVRVVK